MSPRTNIALIAGWLGLIGLGGRFVAWPSFAAARELDAEIAQKQAALSQPGSGPEVIERLARELTTLKSFADARMTPIPQDAGVAQMVAELSGVLDGLGLKDREMTTGAAKQLDEASCLPMSIVIKGDYPSIIQGVAKIEALPRLVRVQRLRVAHEKPVVQATDREGGVKAEILLDVYYAPREVPAEPAKGATK